MIMIISIATSLVLPWLLGTLLVWRVVGNSPNNLPLTLGLGFFAGFFLLTAIMRLWDPANSDISFPYVLIALLLVSVLLAVVPRRPLFPTFTLPLTNRSTLVKWQTWAVLVLAALVALRYYILFAELLLRPLFPWDAFDTWTQRAQEWFLQSPAFEIRMDREVNAWAFGTRTENFGGHPHPYSVSLISLWGMLAAGAHDVPAAHIYWIFAPLAIGLAAYGYLRLRGNSSLSALVAVYLITTLPYINVHAVLAGYADIWLAGTICSAALCLYLWRHQQNLRFLVLGLLFLVFAVSIKRTGLWIGVIALLAMLAATASRKIAWTTVACSAVLVLTGVIGLSMLSEPLDILGVVVIDPEQSHIKVRNLVSLNNIDLIRLLPVLKRAFLEFGSWHILAVFAATALLTAIFLRRNLGRLSPEEWVLPCVFYLVLISIFAFSDKYFIQAESFSTLNRTLLYGVPLLIIAITRLVTQSPLISKLEEPLPLQEPVPEKPDSQEITSLG